MACAAFVTLHAPALAQDTRAGEIAARQAEKSKRLTPNEASGGERVLEWFEHHFTDPSTVYVTFGGVYPSAGLAPGIAWRHAAGHARFNVGGAWSTRNYKTAYASLRFPELANNTLEIDTNTRWLDATQVPFYGIGNDTIREDRVNYGLREAMGGARLTLKPVRWFRIGGGADYRQIEDRAGVGTRPSIETLHTPASAPGLFEKTTYTHATAFTAIDWRESPGYTRRGGLYSVAWNNLTDADDRFGFQQVDIDLRQMIPVLKEHWVFAFRGLVRSTTIDDGQEVPYYLMPTLGGNQAHRAYSDFRYRDRHMLLLSAEYRWLPSRIIDMAFFVDSGKVARERRDLDLENLKTGYGLGIRFHGPFVTPLRIDVARGDEGFRVHFTGGVPF
jgi:hypothetical protein